METARAISRGRHVVADMDVAELGDAQAIKLRRKIRNRHIDAFDRVAQASGGKSIGCSKERKASCEKPRRIGKKSGARD
jgi:hypothetical protein